MLTIISTVGASLYYNYQKQEFEEYMNENGGYQKLFDDGDRKELYKLERLSDKNKSIISGEVEEIDEGLGLPLDLLKHLLYGVVPDKREGEPNGWKPVGKEIPNDWACAETLTISKILKKFKANKVRLIFLASATYISKQIAELLVNRYNEHRIKGVEVVVEEVKVIDGLQILRPALFESLGFSKLLEEIRTEDSKLGDYDNLAINISGGYKVILPPMTIFAQLLGLNLYYIYEDGIELIEAKPLPISFDPGYAARYVSFLRKIGVEEKNATNTSIIEELVENNLLYFCRNAYLPTSFGNLLMQYIKINIPEGKDTLGHIAEHVLYLHFLKCKNSCGIDYSNGNLEHSKKLKFKEPKIERKIEINSREHDLLYFEGKNIIATEVKTWFSLIFQTNKVKNGIIGRLDEFAKTEYDVDWKLREFHLALWKTDDEVLPDLAKIKAALEEWKLAFESKYSIKFKVYEFELDLKGKTAAKKERNIRYALKRGFNLKSILK